MTDVVDVLQAALGWLWGNLIALAALVLSLVNAYRSRHRVTVEARSHTMGIPDPGGGGRNHTFVTVTVRTLRRPVTVEDVSFERPKRQQPAHEDTAIGNLPDDVARPRMSMGAAPGGEFPPTFGMRARLLAEGESVTWACNLGSPVASNARGKAYRAVVQLSDGRKVRSETFWHLQSPLTGWTERETLQGPGDVDDTPA